MPFKRGNTSSLRFFARSQKFMGGMTMIEVIIATAIFSALIFSTLAVLRTSQGVVNTSYVKTALEEKVRFIVERMVKEIRTARRSTLDPPDANNSTIITFEQVIDFPSDNSQDPITNDPITYRLVVDPNDAAGDDVDNDGDGLVDEQIIERIQGGRTVVLTRQVEEGRLRFTFQSPGKLRISMTLAAPDPKKQFNPTTNKYENIIHRVTIETEVVLNTLD